MINYVGGTASNIIIGDPMPKVNYGWTCPKCNKVWNPSESGCRNCNQYFPTIDPFSVPNPYPQPMVPIEPFDFPTYPLSWPEISNPIGSVDTGVRTFINATTEKKI